MLLGGAVHSLVGSRIVLVYAFLSIGIAFLESVGGDWIVFWIVCNDDLHNARMTATTTEFCGFSMF
jgi:hypothetical protein